MGMTAPITRVSVTLDAATANYRLLLSEDLRSVTWSETGQFRSDNRERFNYAPCVLGSQGFTSGRNFWEVDVGDGGFWIIGAARESVVRRGAYNRTPEYGFWSVGLWDRQLRAVTAPLTNLSFDEDIKRVRVLLDYEEGQVSFHNATTMSHVYTFCDSFTEKIYPYFWVMYDTELKL